MIMIIVMLVILIIIIVRILITIIIMIMKMTKIISPTFQIYSAKHSVAGPHIPKKHSPSLQQFGIGAYVCPTNCSLSSQTMIP